MPRDTSSEVVIAIDKTVDAVDYDLESAGAVVGGEDRLGRNPVVRRIACYTASIEHPESSCVGTPTQAEVVQGRRGFAEVDSGIRGCCAGTDSEGIECHDGSGKGVHRVCKRLRGEGDATTTVWCVASIED